MAKKVKVKVVADTKKAATNLKGIDKQFGKLEKSGGTLGKGLGNLKNLFAAGLGIGIAVVAIKKLISSVIEAGDKLGKLSGELGISVEQLSALEYAAELSGGNIDMLEKALLKLSKAVSDADDGLATYVRSFDKLGIEIHDTQGNLRNVKDVFFDLADAIKAGTKNTEDMARVYELLGGRNVKLMNLLKLGSAGMQELMREAYDEGILMTTEQAKAAEKAKDAFYKLNAQFQALLREGLQPIIELLPELLENIRPIIKSMAEFVELHPKILKISIAVGAFTTAIVALKTAAWGLAFAFGGIATALLPLGWGKAIMKGLTFTFAASAKYSLKMIKTSSGLVLKWKHLIMLVSVAVARVGILAATFIGTVAAISALKEGIKKLVPALDPVLSGWEEFTLLLWHPIKAIEIMWKQIKILALEFDNLMRKYVEPLHWALDKVFGTDNQEAIQDNTNLIKGLKDEIQDLYRELAKEPTGPFMKTWIPKWHPEFIGPKESDVKKDGEKAGGYFLDGWQLATEGIKILEPIDDDYGKYIAEIYEKLKTRITNFYEWDLTYKKEYLEAYLAFLEQQLADEVRLTDSAWTNKAVAIKGKIKEVTDTINASTLQSIQYMQDLGVATVDAMISGIIQGDKLAAVMRNITKQIMAAIVKLLIFKGIASAFGLPSFGGFLPFHAGGEIKHAGGPILQSFQHGGEVPVLAQAGEYVTRRAAVTSETRPVLEDINRSGKAPGNTYNIFVNALDTKTLKKAVRDDVLPLIRKEQSRGW